VVLRTLHCAGAEDGRAAPALPRDEIDVADKLRATLPSFQNDFAAMKGLKFSSMREIYNSRLWQSR
jgi:hypothetical protein